MGGARKILCDGYIRYHTNLLYIPLEINALISAFYSKYNKDLPFPRTPLHGYILDLLFRIYTYGKEENLEKQNKTNKDNTKNNYEKKEKDTTFTPKDWIATEDIQILYKGKEIITKKNMSNEIQDDWDIVSYFDNHRLWHKFSKNISSELEGRGDPIDTLSGIIYRYLFKFVLIYFMVNFHVWVTFGIRKILQVL